MSAPAQNGQTKKLTLKELKAQIKKDLLTAEVSSGSRLYSAKVEEYSAKLTDLSTHNICQFKMPKNIEKNDKEKSPTPSERLGSLDAAANSPNTPIQIPNLNKILKSDQPPERIKTKKVEKWLLAPPTNGAVEKISQDDETDNGDDETPEFVGSQGPSTSASESPTKKHCVEDIRDECTIRIKMDENIYRFRLKMNEQFSSLYEKLAEELKIKRTQIFLTRKSNPVSQNDTAETLGLGFAEILDCNIYLTNQNALKSTLPVADPNKISLKFQSQDRREAISFAVDLNESFKNIKEKYTETKNLNPLSVVFMFDGEKINDEQTPIELELENDYCIDVCFNN